MDYIKLSKELSYILRHHPEKYNLSLDSDGFVLLKDLLIEINKRHNFSITEEDVIKVLEISDKKRLEIRDGKIRALYGHSSNDIIKKESVFPPNKLYHGTTHDALSLILSEGLKSMTRQFVHLSIDIHSAIIVGKRRDGNPIILEVDALRAYNDNVNFYLGNENIWLADYIEPKYIKVTGDSNEYKS